MKNTATKIVEKLQKSGFETFWAGGCVRDLILKKNPVDFDIATSARPEQIEKIFSKSFAIGKKFGVILVEEDGFHFEIASFRSDSGFSDGRRPDAVIFSNPREDALRRDFTINGIFFDPIAKKFHDFVRGRADLRRGILKFIGDADARIREDFLRILRAIRFRNRFGLEYDAATARALATHASLAGQVAGERIRDELTKIFLHPSRATALADLKKFGILQVILPEIAKLEKVPQPPDFHGEGNVLQHTFLAMSKISPEKISPNLAWGTLFHDCGKADAIVRIGGKIRFPDHAKIGSKITKSALARLNFAKKNLNSISWLVENHHIFDQFSEMRLSKKLQYFDNEDFENLCELHRADLWGSVPVDWKSRKVATMRLGLIEENFRFARSEKILPSQKKELISGREIMKILKIPAGTMVGKAKKAVREAQIEGKIKTFDDAKKFVSENFANA